MQICVLLSIFYIVRSYRDDGDEEVHLTVATNPFGHSRLVTGLDPLPDGTSQMGGDGAQQSNAPPSGSNDPKGVAVEMRPDSARSGVKTKKHMGLREADDARKAVGATTGGNHAPLLFESARELSCSLHRHATPSSGWFPDWLVPENVQELSIFYHNASIIGRFRKLGLSFPVAPPEGSKLPRIIWSFWDGPAICEVEKLALSSWRLMNPGWDVRVLNFASAMELLQTEFEPLMTKAFIEKLDSWARKTDLIRLMLLQRFGGVWVDATLFCTRPLDSYVFQMVSKANFSAPTWGEPRQPCGSPAGPNTYSAGLSGHFLVAVPHSYIVERWLYAFSHLLYNGPCGDPAEWEYFFIQTTFESLIDTDPRFARRWEEALKLDSRDTHSVWWLEAPMTPELKERIDHPRAPIWKFNKMTRRSSEDVQRCTNVSFACGYIKSRLQNAVGNSSMFGLISYRPTAPVNICNLPDLWLDNWQAANHTRLSQWLARACDSALVYMFRLCTSTRALLIIPLSKWLALSILLLLMVGLCAWFRCRCSLQSSVVK